MKLLVRNLARRTTEKEIEALFSAYGAVEYCVLVCDQFTGKSKGFGFVEMPNIYEASAAMKALNYKNISGNKIRVRISEDKEA